VYQWTSKIQSVSSMTALNREHRSSYESIGCPSIYPTYLDGVGEATVVVENNF